MPLQDVEETEAEAQFRKERAGGNYGGGTKELQLMNFKKRQEQDARRNGLFESGLDKFYKKEIQGVGNLNTNNSLLLVLRQLNTLLLPRHRCGLLCAVEGFHLIGVAHFCTGIILNL